MAFGVQDFHDLVRLLEQHPERRAELRRLVLTEEVLGLPASLQALSEQVQALAQSVRELTEAQRRTEEELAQFRRETQEEFAQVRQEVAREFGQFRQEVAGEFGDVRQELGDVRQELGDFRQEFGDFRQEVGEAQRRTDARFDRLDREVAGLRGDNLERRYRDHAGAYFARLLRRARVVGSVELDTVLAEGLASGALDEDAAHDVRLADLIVRGRRPGDERETFLVVEVSVGIGPDDVERAARRASLLGRVRPTLAVVGGEWLTPEAEPVAEARGVWRLLDGWTVAPDGS